MEGPESPSRSDPRSRPERDGAARSLSLPVAAGPPVPGRIQGRATPMRRSDAPGSSGSPIQPRTKDCDRIPLVRARLPWLRLVGLVELLFEGLVGRRLRRQDAIEVLDLLVLLVVLEVVLELHLLADQGALRVGPEVGRLRGHREGDLPVIAGVLVDLADDDPDVLVAERRDAGRVLVALGHELEQAGGDPWLDNADPHPVAERDQATGLRG